MVKPRPLSPHLQVYRPQMTSMLSIAHRATGIILSTGTLLVCAWLVALALGQDSFETMSELLAHPMGQFVLFGYSAVLIYHALNGIRHMGWDHGFGLTLEWVYRSAYMVLAITFILTALLWAAVWF